MDNLFSTHPNTENRIAELERLAAEIGATGRGQRSSGSPGPWGSSSASPRGPWG
jgi:heat shock protein HtpX